ncbi:phasin family protein [Telmatospirillum sp. J64-1]|uniref:phasin family protein n=1 Tax=Telmatospirillum sp. J64-1 TaxID=2502183 RepID=UPI00115D0F0F|nr:phasin family protein [Telmatospirillum sp. J64-1]
MSERRNQAKASTVEPMALLPRFDSEDMMRAMQSMAEDWSELNSQLANMTNSVFQTNMEALERLRHCQSPQEAVDVQMRMLQKSMDEYLAGTRQAGDLLMHMSSTALSCFRPAQA